MARGLTPLTKFRGKPCPFKAAPSIRASKRKRFSKTFKTTRPLQLCRQRLEGTASLPQLASELSEAAGFEEEADELLNPAVSCCRHCTVSWFGATTGC